MNLAKLKDDGKFRLVPADTALPLVRVLEPADANGYAKIRYVDPPNVDRVRMVPADRLEAVPDVFAYFAEKLGTEPSDETLKELPVDSGCGDDCRKAIRAARRLLKHARMAGGDSAADVISAADTIVQIYWRG